MDESITMRLMNLEQVIGKKSVDLSFDELHAEASKHERVHVDLGTGDGLFAWRLARKHPETLVIGIDAARESLREGSARAIKKPARGGAPNAYFICANALENLENSGWDNFADHMTINFPWGSLLQATCYPYEDFLSTIYKMIKDEGKLELHINMYVFGDDEQRRSLGLPELDDAYMESKFIPAYEKAGFKLDNYLFVPAGQKTDIQSTWGSKLTRRSKRPTLVVMLTKEKAA